MFLPCRSTPHQSNLTHHHGETGHNKDHPGQAQLAKAQAPFVGFCEPAAYVPPWDQGRQQEEEGEEEESRGGERVHCRSIGGEKDQILG